MLSFLPPCSCDYFTFIDNIIAEIRLDAFTLYYLRRRFSLVVCEDFLRLRVAENQHSVDRNQLKYSILTFQKSSSVISVHFVENQRFCAKIHKKSVATTTTNSNFIISLHNDPSHFIPQQWHKGIQPVAGPLTERKAELCRNS